MTSIQSGDELCKNCPYKLLISKLIGLPKLLNEHGKIPASAILHIHMEILGSLDVFSVVVFDDVGVP